MFKKKYRTQDTADLNNLCTGITQVNKNKQQQILHITLP